MRSGHEDRLLMNVLYDRELAETQLSIYKSPQGVAHSHFHSLFNFSDAEIQCDHNFRLLVDSLVVIIFN